MKINRLWLLNFRNYENAEIDFADNTLLVGQNGAGKTNILEAIDILATSRSKIVKGLNKCIRHGQAGFVINGRFSLPSRTCHSVEGNPGSDSFTVAFRQEREAQRTIKIDDTVLSSTSELIGKVNSVIFLPGDLEIIQGSPAARRKYLDICISQTARDYYKALQDYARALKQRNELLKTLRHSDGNIAMLDIWDKQIAELSAQIVPRRRECLEFFARETAKLYREMGFTGEVTIRYKTDMTADKQKNLEILIGARGKDMRFGRTHYGTHADDFEIFLNDSKAAEFCSQGQQRLLAVAFKCAEAKLKAEKLQDPPIVLIDDVLLELDLERLNKIIASIAPESQKIFTVTDTSRFSAEILQTMKIVKIANGRIS